MLNYILRLSFLLVFVFPQSSIAQRAFTEGLIKYNVRMTLPMEGSTAKPPITGTYTITTKGKLVRKELTLNNGYHNIVLINGNTNISYSLQLSGTNKFAIQLGAADIRKIHQVYENFSLKEESQQKIIGGLQAQAGTIQYKNGTTATIFFSKEWKPTIEYLYDRLPGINYLPLSMEYKTEDGMLVTYVAEKIEFTPQESSQFIVPKDYKIISNEEYKKLSQ